MSDSLEKLQDAEQAMHSQAVQRQSYEARLIEIEAALAELEDAEESYQLIGNLMVKRQPEKAIKQLEEQRETTKHRLEALKRHEKSLRERFEKLQKEALGDSDE